MSGHRTFKLRLLHAVVIDGRRWLRGAELQADAAAARELIGAGTAHLADDADLPRLIQQVGADRPRPVVR